MSCCRSAGDHGVDALLDSLSAVVGGEQTGEGKEELIQAIASLAGTDALNPSEGILSNERQRANVSAALRSVREAKAVMETGMTFDAVTVSLEDAISELLEMTGERTSDEVIDRVFHNFCVGK